MIEGIFWLVIAFLYTLAAYMIWGIELGSLGWYIAGMLMSMAIFHLALDMAEARKEKKK